MLVFEKNTNGRIKREKRKTRKPIYYLMPNNLGVRLHRNRAERELQIAALKSGWEIYYIGLLDFLCHDPKTGEALFIEVKSTGNGWQSSTLSRRQKAVVEILEKKGMKVVIFQAGKDNPYKIFNSPGLKQFPPGTPF